MDRRYNTFLTSHMAWENLTVCKNYWILYTLVFTKSLYFRKKRVWKGWTWGLLLHTVSGIWLWLLLGSLVFSSEVRGNNYVWILWFFDHSYIIIFGEIQTFYVLGCTVSVFKWIAEALSDVSFVWWRKYTDNTERQRKHNIKKASRER